MSLLLPIPEGKFGYFHIIGQNRDKNEMPVFFVKQQYWWKYGVLSLTPSPEEIKESDEIGVCEACISDIYCIRNLSIHVLKFQNLGVAHFWARNYATTVKYPMFTCPQMVAKPLSDLKHTLD